MVFIGRQWSSEVIHLIVRLDVEAQVLARLAQARLTIRLDAVPRLVVEELALFAYALVLLEKLLSDGVVRLGLDVALRVLDHVWPLAQ